MKKKFFTKERLVIARRMILSRSFMVALLFAIALWSFNTMNEIYVINHSIPLSIIVPENRAIEGNIPDMISVKLRGQGWNLFYLMNFNNTARCDINLSKSELSDHTYRLTRRDIITGVQDMINIETIDVGEDIVTINIGKMVEKKIPVLADIELKTRDLFMLAGEIKVIPDSIVIRGNKNVIDTINLWYTERIEIDDVYKPTTIKAAMLKPSSIVTLSDYEVSINADVQQIAEICLCDVPVLVKGGRLPRHSELLPNKLTVFLRGGAKDLAKYNIIELYKEISVTVDYSDINNDSVLYIQPAVKSPPHIEVLKTEPLYIVPLRYISKN